MLDINEIMKIIPQRPPFLMIDRVEEYVPGEHPAGADDPKLPQGVFR